MDAEPQGRSAGLSHLVTENSIKPLQTRVEPRLQTELVHRPRGSHPWLWGKPIRSSIPCPQHPTRGPAGGASCTLPRSRPSLLAPCWGRHPPTSSPHNTCGPLAGLCLCARPAARGSFLERESDPSPTPLPAAFILSGETPLLNTVPRAGPISSPGFPSLTCLSCFRQRVRLPLC